MKFNLINRLFEKFEKNITIFEKKRFEEFFQGYNSISPKSSDSPLCKKLISNYNTKIKAYNDLGETLALLIVHKWSDLQPQAQDNLLGVIDEYLRMRTNKKKPGCFKQINQSMHLVEDKMSKLALGQNGIESLKKQIVKNRK